MTTWLCTLTLCLAADAPAAEFKLNDAAVVRFATADEGRQVLTADDAFTRSLSRFDLQSRLKTADEVTFDDWKRFAASHVREWEAEETKAVSESLARLSEPLAELRLPLPPQVLLVRTSGEEEANAAYTRGTAIILPTKVMSYGPNQLDRLLAHELFHVLSRHDGAFRSRLYRIVGFSLCDPIEFPPSLAPRRITNPDAPLVDCTIELKNAEGQAVTAAPILYASSKEYDSKGKRTMFSYLTFRLLVVEQSGGRWQPRLVQGEPVVIDPKKEPSFQEQIGKNTNYIIHPDEILADNFVHLVMGTKMLQTPRIIDQMRAALAK
jgi:hypothetical protein